MAQCRFEERSGSCPPSPAAGLAVAGDRCPPAVLPRLGRYHALSPTLSDEPSPPPPSPLNLACHSPPKPEIHHLAAVDLAGDNQGRSQKFIFFIIRGPTMLIYIKI